MGISLKGFDVTTGSLLHTLDNPNAYGTSANDYFGTSVSITSNNVIIGAPYENSNLGTAYIYTI